MPIHRLGGLLILISILWVSIPSSRCSPVTARETSGSGPRIASHRLSPRHRREYKEKCQAGKEYRVTSVEYLKENIADLQCIFWTAEEPTKVPEGPLYGDVLSFGNVGFLNSVLRTFWKGKFIEKVECKQNETFLGWNRILGRPLFPFVAYLGIVPDHSNPHPLYRDNKTSLLIDYRADMSTVCPDYVHMKGRSFETLRVRKSPVNRNIYPINAVLDVVRFVGRQEDGGALLLGQLFEEDKFATDKMSKPVCFFTIVSYDSQLNKQFVHGQSLKPLESDRYYKNQNLLDLLVITLPLDNVLSHPIHAVKTMASGVVPSARNIGNVIWDTCCASGGDSDRMSEEFKAFQPNVTSSSRTSRSKFISKHEDFHSHFKEL